MGLIADGDDAFKEVGALADVGDLGSQALGLSPVYPAPAQGTVAAHFVVDILAFMFLRMKVRQARPTGSLARSARVDVHGGVVGVYDDALDAQDFHDLCTPS